jgi:hypothetical protein
MHKNNKLQTEKINPIYGRPKESNINAILGSKLKKFVCSYFIILFSLGTIIKREQLHKLYW